MLLLNVGPTRADGLPGLVKLGVRTGAILGDVTRAVMYKLKFYIVFSDAYLFSSVVLEHKMILWLPKCCGAVLRTRRYVMMTSAIRGLPVKCGYHLRIIITHSYHTSIPVLIYIVVKWRLNTW